MSISKKLVKFFAEVLALLIIGLMIVGTLYLIYFLTMSFGNKNTTDANIKIINDSMKDSIDNYSFNITTIKTNVKIVKSDSFNIDTNNRNILIDYDNSNKSIIINEKKLNLFNYNESYDMTVYLPSTLFKETSITTKSGNVVIDNLVTNVFNLNVGDGKTSIDNLTVYKSANVSTGVGKVDLNGALINNLYLSNGVGETKIKANVTGNSSVNSGAGNIYMEVLQPSNYFTFKIDKALGEVIIDGESFTSGTLNTGPSIINIESGIGKIEIKCNNE